MLPFKREKKEDQVDHVWYQCHHHRSANNWRLSSQLFPSLPHFRFLNPIQRSLTNPFSMFHCPCFVPICQSHSTIFKHLKYPTPSGLIGRKKSPIWKFISSSLFLYFRFQFPSACRKKFQIWVHHDRNKRKKNQGENGPATLCDTGVYS